MRDQTPAQALTPLPMVGSLVGFLQPNPFLNLQNVVLTQFLDTLVLMLIYRI